MADLVTALADQGIRLKGYAASSNHRIVCPRCEGGRSKERSLSVTIDQDGEGATWVCHRGTCGWADGLSARERRDDRDYRQHQRKRREPEKPPVRPTPPAATPRPDKLFRWFAKRGIDEEVVAEMGIYLRPDAYFPDKQRREPGICFPYMRAGRLVNAKYRSSDKRWAQEKGAEPILYNLDQIDADLCVIVEGEVDVLSVMTAGIRSVTTLPVGAPDKVREDTNLNDDDDKRFAALRNCADAIEPVKKFIIATDADGPGRALAEEWARRLGKHRCWLLVWPGGYKDANEVLAGDEKKGLAPLGADVLRRLIDNAEPYPISGVVEIKHGDLIRLRNSEREVLYSPPWPVLAEILKFPIGGMVFVVTGAPNSGKSTWVDDLLVGSAAQNDWHTIIFSPESGAPEEHASKLAEQYTGKPFRAYRQGVRPMDDFDVEEAEAWIGDHFTWIRAEDETQQADIDFLLDRAKSVLLRRGSRWLVIDPWNEVEHSRPKDMSDTDYIGQSLMRLRKFARHHACNVIVVAHPAKLQRNKDGTISPPGGYDIANSANWFNKPDFGVTVHRPDLDSPKVEIHIWKVRFRQHGRKGCALLHYDVISNRYRDWDDCEPADEETVAEAQRSMFGG